MMSDVVIVGGGVIGLATAWELAGQGVKVRVLDRSSPGTEASWAGAGMIPPGDLLHAATHQLAVLSVRLWPKVSSQLQQETGIDSGYRPCGGLLLEGGLCQQIATTWRERGVTAQLLDAKSLRELAPAISNTCQGAVFLPEQAQVRNPRHLQSLAAACAKRGVQILPQQQVLGWDHDGERIHAVRTNSATLTAGEFLVAAGAWSADLLQPLGIPLAVRPMRGQMVLLKAAIPCFTQTLECGSLYLVPRDDGHILVGATVEDVGFDKTTIPSSLLDLQKFANRLVPQTADYPVVKTWAGLRPYSALNHPVMGRVAGWKNLILATGHYRAGLSNSPATSLLIRQLILGQKTSIDLAPFGLTSTAEPH